jgi:hypothetical protein
MFQPCGEWETCMNRDPSKIGRARIGAQLLAEIVNAFVENISWKTFVSILVISQFIHQRCQPSRFFFSSSPWSRSRFLPSSSTPFLHSIDRKIITHQIPHPYQYPIHNTSCRPRHHAEASLVPGGSPETTEMVLGPQQEEDGWMALQYPRLREAEAVMGYMSWRPRKTFSITL